VLVGEAVGLGVSVLVLVGVTVGEGELVGEAVGITRPAGRQGSATPLENTVGTDV
jgi:acetyltransferase-like isoleucine patch superfamily enzyme